VAVLLGLVLLVVIAIVAGTMIQGGASRRRQLILEERRVQAEWLVESGLQRAAVRLARSGDYTGETWVIPTGEIDGEHEALVQISVEKVQGQESERRIRIDAEFPRADDRRVRQERIFVIQTVRKADGASQ
jgi:type II secretory pathway component PulK